MFTNFISSRIDLISSTHSQSFDFPIIFFDRYLTMIQRPFQDRYNHLQRVLYQTRTRMILIAISSLGEDPFEIEENDSSVENEERRICESVLSNWMRFINMKWSELGVFGSNLCDRIRSLPIRDSLKNELMKMGESCVVCERVKNIRTLTLDCYCTHCESSIEVSIHWNSFSCPYCGFVVVPKLMIVKGISIEEVEEVVLMTPEALNEAIECEDESTSNALWYSVVYLAFRYVPFPIFSRLDVYQTAVDIVPISILSALFQLEAISVDSNECYESLQGYIGESILRLQGVSMKRETMEERNWNELIESVSIAILTLSPNREREYDSRID